MPLDLTVLHKNNKMHNLELLVYISVAKPSNDGLVGTGFISRYWANSEQFVKDPMVTTPSSLSH